MKNPEHLVWTPEMVKNFWDYESRFPDNYFTYKRATEIVRKISPYLNSGAQVLDYGCGPGYLIDKLIKAGVESAALDFSDKTITDVANRFAAEPAFLGAYTPDSLRDSGRRFDAVTVIEVVEHLYDEQLLQLFNSLRAALKPGGIAIFSTPNEEDLDKSMILCPASNKLFHRWQHVQSWSGDTLRDCLACAGFETVDVFTTNFSVSFHTDHSKHPLKNKWVAFRRKLKALFKGRRKQPHLVAIARAVRTG